MRARYHRLLSGVSVEEDGYRIIHGSGDFRWVRESVLAKWHPVERNIIETQVLERGFSDVYRKEYRAKDGTAIPVEVQRCLLRDAGGRPDGMWVIVRSMEGRAQSIPREIYS